MSLLSSFLSATWMLLCESAPYLLVGFFLAGLIKTVISTERVQRHLGENSFRSVLRASLYGVPIPLCSCSVIPTAASLRKNGASKGATSAFLISTPETGVDSIGVTWALLDPIMTVVRPVAAFLSALLTGSLVNLWARHDEPVSADRATAPEASAPPAASCCHSSTPASASAIAEPAPAPTLTRRLRDAVRYGYGTLLDDLTPWFVIGFLLSGLIATLTPANLFADSLPGGLAAMLLMLVVGLPLYVCATASTPIAAVLIAKGLSPGAALVFLLVGPATNVTTLMVVRSLLGGRVLAIYLVSIALVALGSGLAVDWLYPTLGIDLTTQVSEVMAHHPGPLGQVAGAVLLVLLAFSARRIHLIQRWKSGLFPSRGEATQLAGPGSDAEPAGAAPEASRARDESKIAS